MTPGRRRLTALRLAAQHVGADERSTPAEAVRWMLALQGQDFPGVKWSVGLRAAGATVAGVNAALDAGEIVRSWPLRGTLHLVAGEDLRWLLALTTPRVIGSAAARRAALGLTETEMEHARAVATEALGGRRVPGRGALLAALDADGVSTTGARAYHLLWYLAQTGTLVLGPTNGTQQAFALLDDWVAHPARRLEGDEALGELALRYFRSHGPATARSRARIRSGRPWRRSRRCEPRHAGWQAARRPYRSGRLKRGGVSACWGPSGPEWVRRVAGSAGIGSARRWQRVARRGGGEAGRRTEVTMANDGPGPSKLSGRRAREPHADPWPPIDSRGRDSDER